MGGRGAMKHYTNNRVSSLCYFNLVRNDALENNARLADAEAYPCASMQKNRSHASCFGLHEGLYERCPLRRR